MIRILICDDVQGEMDELKLLIGDYYSSNDVTIACYPSGRSALQAFTKGPAPDIMFLDILMPYMKGTVLARRLRDAGYAGYLVFLTSSNSFAAESYGVDAHSYLLKPPSAETVGAVLRSIEADREKRDRAVIRIKSKKGISILPVRELSHIEIWKHHLIFHKADGESVEVYASCRDYEAQINADPRLMRCHHSFFVNAEQVVSVTGDDILMRSGKQVPISKKYASFKIQYAQWLFGEDSK